MAESLKVAGVRLVVEGAKEYEERLRGASRALSQNAAEMRKLDEQYGRGSTNTEYLSQKKKLLNEQLSLQQKRTQALRDALAAYAKEQDAQPEKIAAMNLAITRSEGLEARFARQIRETGAALEETGDAMTEAGENAAAAGSRVDKARGSFREMGKDAQGAAARLRAFGNAAIAQGEKISRFGSKASRMITVPVIGGFAYAAKEAIDFESAYANVRKTVDGTAEEMANLRQEIIELSGAGFVTQSKEEIAEVAAAAGQLGIQLPNIMGFSTAMLQLNDATNLTSEEASESLAQFANITGMAQTKFSNLGSAIVDLGNNSAAQEDAIVALSMRMAAAGTTAGMHVADIMGLSAAFASVGMNAEAGGTAVSKLILDMDTSVAKSERASKKYADIAGMSARQFRELWRQDAAGGFTAFIEGLQRIQQEGGNVALVLEKMGIKDQRMRDAMLRAVNAGDLLGQSIERSNAAYLKNTALAEEAAAKNNTFAARMSMLKNRFDNAAMGLGDSLMPMLEDAMTVISGLVDGFGDLDEGARSFIVWAGLGVAAIGPVTKALGGLVKGVGHLSRALSFATSPWGAVALGAAAFGLLGVAIASIKTPLQQVQERMRNLEFAYNEESLKKMLAGIEQGIAAANREYTLRASVKVEMDNLAESVDKAFADGKVNWREQRSLKQQLDGLIKAGHDAAQEELQASVNSYVATLSGLKDASGQDLFSEEDKAALVQGITTKTSALIEQLNQYQTEYDTLLNTVYKQRQPVTAQQMAEMDQLLEKIGLVRAELKLAHDEVVQSAKVMYEMTAAGKGTEQTAAVAAGYLGERHRQKVREAEQQQTGALAILEQAGQEDGAKLEKAAAVVQGAAQQVKEADMELAQGVGELMEGLASQNAELAHQLERAADAYQRIKQLDAYYESGEDFSAEKLEQILPSEMFSRYEESRAWGVRSIDELDRARMPIAIYVSELYELMNQEVAAAAESLSAENPLTALLKSALEQDIQVDPALADGLLADLLQVLDFAGRGEEFGLDLTGGIGTSLEDPEEKRRIREGSEDLVDEAETGLDGMGKTGETAGDNLTGGFIGSIFAAYRRAYIAAAGLGQSAIDGLNSKKGIDAQSPSRKTARSGRWYVDGFLEQLTGMMPQVRKAAGELGSDAVSALSRSLERPMLPAGVSLDYSLGGDPEALARELRLALGGEGGQGKVTNNYDESVPVTIQQLNVRQESDVYAIGLELANINRRRRAGYGS